MILVQPQLPQAIYWHMISCRLYSCPRGHKGSRSTAESLIGLSCCKGRVFLSSLSSVLSFLLVLEPLLNLIVPLQDGTPLV